MNRDFFVRLAFATHRVADALGEKQEIAEEIREAANAVLADLILLTEREMVSGTSKHALIPRLERQLDILIVYLHRAREAGRVNPDNFVMLEQEYTKIRELLEIFEGLRPETTEEPRSPDIAKKEGKRTGSPPAPISRNAEDKNGEALTRRQQKIIEFLKTKESAQVWELQKVLPEVTKRTLRRDLDELLQKNLVERKGEWNAVSYELK